jgi:uncharacterized protein (DUF362 family)
MFRHAKTVLIYAGIGALCLVSLAGVRAPRAAEKEASPAAAASALTTPAAALNPGPVVGIGRGKDFASVTKTAIENAGGLAGVVKKGDVVLIKPNLCTGPRPDMPTTTDYRVTQAVVDAVKALGPSKVIVAEGSFYGDSFKGPAFSMSKYDTIKGVEFFEFNSCDKRDCYEVSPKDSLLGKALFIPKPYMDANVVITVAKLKTHFQPDAVVSLCLKNAFGVPPERIYGGGGYKAGLHNFPLKDAIVELNKIRKPDFCVIDGIIGGERFGPANNTPVDSQIVFAGVDPVAVDAVGLTFMGFTVDQVPHVKLAAERNLGIADLSRIQVKGADLNAIKMDFKSTFKSKSR